MNKKEQKKAYALAEKLLAELKEEIEKPEEQEEDVQTVISNNLFQGVVWDGEAISAVNNTARALLNITEVFKSQRINITLLKVGGTEVGKYVKEEDE